MKKFIEIVGWTSGLATIVAALLSAAWFLFGLDARIGTLEKQMQALYQVAVPTSEEKHPSGNDPDASGTASASPHSDSLSKLAATCSDLAIRVADAYKDNSPATVALPLERMMENLGCNKLIQ